MTRLAATRTGASARATAALLATLALALTGCGAQGTSPEKSDAEASSRIVIEPEAGAFPVAVDHAFGTFELDEAPERVVTIGWASEDISAALGVVPIAVPESWAGDDDGLVPWFRDTVETAGAPLPETLNDIGIGEIDFEQILALKPDAIIAPFSGITDTQYERLEEIAPTLAYPEKPWSLDWQDHAELMGEALGRPALAKHLVADTRAAVEAQGAEHPEFKDATFVYSTAVSEGSTDVGFHAPSTSLIGIIEDLGLALSPQVVDRAKQFADEIYFGVSLEKVDEIEADVFLGVVNNQDEVDYALAQPHFASWQPIANDHAVWLTDRQVSQAVAAPSVLSVPWVLDEFVPELAEALAR
ncbi:ABC transporter substrate-binding protein [Leucobacter sp. UCMA 4100]|uniref:ABC transporter substrate-binding protein n=1 Tax=Leucobacter sp. UCMA 4100 TaxID=2810534 RepID=UPI0022EB0822|nr:ABC transporter substrate-binding protein [Leucobacter sp. UCMA 4100]MDA3146890.1 ABC transporter substrate-binding protein [Leucobacter sp. UCMA 4100]